MRDPVRPAEFGPAAQEEGEGSEIRVGIQNGNSGVLRHKAAVTLKRKHRRDKIEKMRVCIKLQIEKEP